MFTNRTLRLASHAPRAVLALAVLGLLAGCQTPGRPGTGGAPAPIDATGLSARPLYTFNETELGTYLRDVRDREPELTRRIIRLARQNIGQPYDIYLLGEFPYEFYDPDPIYCLSRSDCLTFCEHIYAMALSSDWWSFLRALQRLRYRDGTIGMLTRNHYTIADWDRNNRFLFEDLTQQLGGGRACVPLQQVCRRAKFFEKFGLGQDIPDEPIADFYVPKERVPGITGELREGDFVNIIRGNAESQYCGHTGLIAIAADGTVDFLHSARPAVREQPLTEYLTGDKTCLGIKILRLRDRAEALLAAALADSPAATDVSPAALTTALAASPLMSTGAPPSYPQDWVRAMNLQAYRLTYDTPVDPELQATLAAVDERIGTQLGIPQASRAFGVLDLTDLRLALLQPDVMFYGASVPKICIVLAYFNAHPEAADTLAPEVERELQLILKRSDNELAAKYSQLVGLDAIQELVQSKRYRFYDAEHGGGLWCGKHYGLDAPRVGDPLSDHSHATTVRQCLRYYLMLEQGQLVNAAVSARLKRLFAAPDLEFHNEGFVRGLNGRAVSILRKSGLWEDWHLDTARVQHGERMYLLAGMVQHANGNEYLAGMAAAVDEALCGSEPSARFAHRLRIHTSPADFGAGQLENATLSADPAGMLLNCLSGDGLATYESPIVETDAKFNELLVSWNLATPPGAGVCIEARVGRRWDDSWSPYLYFGDWGDAVPAVEKVVACDAGKIDVDYFRSNQRFDRVQYRIHATCALGQETVIRIARIALCTSDLTGIPPALSPPRSPDADPPAQAWQRRLPVPFRAQRDEDPAIAGRICSPTSVAMVMAYRGVDRPTAEVVAACFDPTHEIWGNWPRCVQGAYSLGVPGHLARFSDWTAVERLIADGQPLVISIRVDEEGGLAGAPYRTSDGHLLVLTGFDADGNVAVNDPAARNAEKGRATYRRCDLEQVWMRATGGVAYVLLPRGG